MYGAYNTQTKADKRRQMDVVDIVQLDLVKLLLLGFIIISSTKVFRSSPEFGVCSSRLFVGVVANAVWASVWASFRWVVWWTLGQSAECHCDGMGAGAHTAPWILNLPSRRLSIRFERLRRFDHTPGSIRPIRSESIPNRSIN